MPCTLLAREDVAVEADAIEQLLQLLELQDTLDDLWRRECAGSSTPFFGDAPGRIVQVVLTTDACPTPGPTPENLGPFLYTGHPVIVPGSTRDASHAGGTGQRCHARKFQPRGGAKPVARATSHVDARRFLEQRLRVRWFPGGANG